MSERYAMTVLGPVAPEDLGVTLTHEHCFIDASVWFFPPEDASQRLHVDSPVTMALLSDLRRRPFSTTRDNMILSDETQILGELLRYRDRGGHTVVDVTPMTMGRDPTALQRLARGSGLNIILATGIYVENAHPAWVTEMSVDEIAQVFIRELTEGIGETGIRCGLIGEIGISGIPRGSRREKVGPITSEEEKVLHAAARAALVTGAAVTVHLDPVPPLAGTAAIDVLLSDGLEPDRIVIGHMDQVADYTYHRAVAETGVFVEYDSLGRDHYAQEWGYGFDWGHDSWRTRFLMRLVADGFGEQLLLSQDVCLKTDLVSYGGPGYGHILQNIVPALRELGLDAAAIERMLITNPARVLAIESADLAVRP